MIQVLTAISLAMTPVAAEPRPVPDPAPATTEAATPKADAKRYCIVETITGSRMPKRVCHTRGEWHDLGVDPLKPE